MKCYYDFHIHTALSPCGHVDMSPNNIVNMAKICDLNAIAITDHNSCENVKAVMEVASEQGIIVVPAMEIETREEIHVVCFFSEVTDVYNVQEIIYGTLPNIKNRTNIFGDQLIFDENDSVVGENDRFLSTAANLSIDELFNICEKLGGVAVPAHIDRPSYSILSNLGLIPDQLPVTTVEVSKYVDDFDKYRQEYRALNVIQSSDAHDLEAMVFQHRFIEVEELSVQGIINYLRGTRGIK